MLASMNPWLRMIHNVNILEWTTKNFTFPRNVYVYWAHNSKEQTFYSLLSHKGYTSTSEFWYANISLLSALGDKVEKMTQHEGKGGMASWAKYLSRRAAGWPIYQYDILNIIILSMCEYMKVSKQCFTETWKQFV